LPKETTVSLIEKEAQQRNRENAHDAAAVVALNV